MNNKKKWIIGIILIIIISIPISISIKNYLQLKDAQNEFNRIMSGVDEQVPDLMRPKLLDSSLIRDVSVTIDSSVEQVKYHDFYHWIENCVVTFYMDDGFDNLTDRAQYNFINEHGDLVRDVKSEIVRNLFPKYNAYYNFMTEENTFLRSIYGSSVFPERNYDVFFKTTNNTYKHAGNVDDYFVKNGKDYWIRTNAAPAYSAENSTITDGDRKCALSHCDRSVRPGKKYCWTHACCKSNCYLSKDPSAHCCSIHCCAHEKCGLHRYDYAGSNYCKVHMDEH